MNGVRRSCRCIGPVARRSRGEWRGRKVAWPTRSGDNGKNRFQADRQLLRYRLAPWSLRCPLPFPPRWFLCSKSSSSSLVLCLLFALPLSSPPRLRPAVSLLFSLLRTLVSQTLAKPRRRQRLSCRSTQPLRFHRDGSGSFFAVIFIVSRPLTLIAAFSTSIFNCNFSSMTRKAWMTSRRIVWLRFFYIILITVNLIVIL